MKKIILFILLTLYAFSCAPIRSGTFTIASPDKDISIMGLKHKLVKKAATHTVSIPIFLFPWGTPPKDNEAMREILKEHDGDFLTNITVESKSEIILFFGSQKTIVTADVWKIVE